MRPATRSTSLASMTDVDMSEPVSGKGERTRKASTTVSTRSTRRTASPSRSSKQDDAGPPTPESPPFRLTRKRAASLAADHKGGDDDDGGGRSSNNKDEADDVVEAITPSSTTHSRMSSGGASAGSAGSAASHVCLCQPDPKIPRPRNGQLSSTLSLCCFPCCLHYLIFSLKKKQDTLPSQACFPVDATTEWLFPFLYQRLCRDWQADRLYPPQLSYYIGSTTRRRSWPSTPG